MGKPAARLGDMTAHGGSIVVGLPTVLIGGMPAARVGDMHVCPMLNPGVPPPPHVGGPIMMGSPMVLIGGMPAARMGDMVTCAGPPDTIMLGCMTVLIGEGGSGSASGGGSGMSAAAAAQASAANATAGSKESTTKHEHWVEYKFADKAGLPVSGIAYEFTGPGGVKSESVLQLDGRVARDALSKGQCAVVLRSVFNAKWAKNKAEVGQKVKLTADVEGFDDGTPATVQIYRRDIQGPDYAIETIETKVDRKKVEIEWEYAVSEIPEKTAEGDVVLDRFSAPEYYGDVLVKQCKSRSDLLGLEDWIEIKLKDEKGKAIGNKKITVHLPNGEIRKGSLDGSGYVKIKDLPPGPVKVLVDPRQ
jgi:uncharacterized Zn-binding protein involved in type VI secretion